MARDKEKKRDKSGNRDKFGGNDRAKEEAAEAERKKKSDSFFYTLVILLVIFVLSMRFGSALGSPWSEILIVVQIICPMVAGVLFFRTFPHPLRSMNRRLAEERRSIAREAKKKKRRGF